MKKIILFVVALLTVSFASLDVTSFENGSQNQSIPNIRLKNNGGNISGFKIYYYFSAADTKDILIDSYYLAGGSAAIEKITENQYRAVLDFSGNALGAGKSFPNSGYLQFGLHYYDWSKWNEKDDFSYLGNQINSLNDRIVVTSLSGDVLAGVFPNGTDLSLEPCVVKIYSKSQSENNYGRFQLYAKNEGHIPITHFDFDIEITSEKGLIPVVDEWYLANTVHTLEQKDFNTWILHFSVHDINLEPNSIYPNESGLSFGIHYMDWSDFDLSNDYAFEVVNNKFEVNEKIPVYVDGKLVFGNPKIHDVIDIKKIIATENGYTLDEFDKPVDSLIKSVPDVEISWEDFDMMEYVVFKNVPDFDTTSNAFFSILDKFKGLDTMYLVRNFKEVKSIYEQLVRLRMVSYFSKSSHKEGPLFARHVYIDLFGKKSLTGDEFEALLYNPMRITGMKRAADLATKWAKDYAKKILNSENTGDNRADGFRHAVWNALMCRETGTQFDDISECLNWARRFANAHEQNSNPYAFATVMDFHNNKIGRDAYAPKLRVTCEWDWGFTCVNEKVVGPSREETKEMYENLAKIAVGFNDVSQLEQSPWIRRIVFFMADNGKYYCKKNESPSNDGCEDLNPPALLAQKIAVLKKDSNFVCDETIVFHLDLEDDDNGSKILSGDPNPPGIDAGGGGITFKYCVLDMKDFNYQIPRVRYDYIVLRMDNDCPEGTYAFRRYHDTEDSNNANASTDNLGPSYVTKNASLEYCFVPADSNSKLEYPFDAKYGVFANVSSANIIHSEIYMDDEDSHNANSWDFYGAPQNIQDRIAIIMNGSSNTIYYVVKWIELVLNKITKWMEV